MHLEFNVSIEDGKRQRLFGGPPPGQWLSKEAKWCYLVPSEFRNCHGIILPSAQVKVLPLNFHLKQKMLFEFKLISRIFLGGKWRKSVQSGDKPMPY